eukprot:jgi/Mesvir1/6251/Mv00970-RA.1
MFNRAATHVYRAASKGGPGSLLKDALAASRRSCQTAAGSASTQASESTGVAGTKGSSSWMRKALIASGVGTAAFFGIAEFALADEAEHGMHAPAYPWPHDGIFGGYDHSSIRRGYKVYKEVCASCHSLDRIAYRDLVGVAFTEAEAKAMAEEEEYTDGPNDEGEMFQRPGKLSDYIKGPYANEQAARAANGGAYPPDLSLITKARHDGQNYLYALLTGYRAPPAGVEVREGLHYNPYFPGGAIAMPKMLMDDGVDYDDGTDPSAAQLAKDVTTFLTWAADPYMEDRKLMGMKWMAGLTLALVAAVYYKRWRWSNIKSRKLVFDVVN